MFSVLVFGQIPTNPVCDEALEIPYTFSYSGFIIYDGATLLNTSPIRLWIGIHKDNPDGERVFSEFHVTQFQKSGFFNVDIGSVDTEEFLEFVLQMNEEQGVDYHIVVSMVIDGQYQIIGSKPIETVPYALVANSIGGIGPRGEQGEPSNVVGPVGPTGASGQGGIGAAGPSGLNGLDGPDGFGIMLMRNSPPATNALIYVDDGTNTLDGKPHLRYLLNGTWVDL